MAYNLLNALRVSTAAMEAQSKRILTSTENLANANSQAETPGGLPYQRKTVEFAAHMDPKLGIETVRVKKIGRDPAPFKKVYMPDSPGADKDGFVLETNVKSIMEMVDMRDASRSYEAITNGYKKVLEMIHDNLSIFKA